MTPSRSRKAAGLRTTGLAVLMGSASRLCAGRLAEHLALDQMADGVTDGDVKLLDQRGLVRRRADHDVAERVHRRLAAAGEADGDELPFARDLQRRKNVRRLARGGDADDHIAGLPERADLA